MDNSFQINDGLRIARKLLLDINDSGLPAAGEFLDMITPQYHDLMSWGAELAHVPPNRRCTANWHQGFLLRVRAQKWHRRYD